MRSLVSVPMLSALISTVWANAAMLEHSMQIHLLAR